MQNAEPEFSTDSNSEATNPGVPSPEGAALSNEDSPQEFSTSTDPLLVAMREQMSKVLVGQANVLDQALIALLASGHVLLEGVPGLGKTLLVSALARTLQSEFSRVQFTPDLMPSDVVGHTVYDSSAGQFRLKKGPAFTNFLLADEINRAPARTQAALLEVMQERQITIDGETNVLESPFIVFATQNPIEQEGTYPLPEAQLDRFLLKIVLDYPSAEEELLVVQSVTAGKVGGQFALEDLHAAAGSAQILEAQQRVANLKVDDSVARYAVDLVRATRNTAGFSVGSGPRGAIALVRAARAMAYLEGRDFVVPDDVRHVALPALRHRVIPAPELSLEGRAVDSI